MEDNYYLCSKAYIKSDKKVAFNPHDQIKAKLNHFPENQGHLNHGLNSANTRLIRSANDNKMA